MNNSKPLVSIVMPAFNVESYISEAIQSIQNQSYSKWELIVVDDGSTDMTLAVVHRLAKMDSRIVIVTGPNTGHPAKARNKGLRRVKGDLVGFLDSDDFMYPTKLEEQVAAFNAFPDVDICFHDIIEVDEFGVKDDQTYLNKASFQRRSTDYFRKVGKLFITDSSFFQFMSSQVTSISTINVMLRAKTFKSLEFNESLLVGEDIDLWFRLVLQASKLAYIDKPLSAYRKRNGSITTNTIKTLQGFIKAHSINLKRGEEHLTKEQKGLIKNRISKEYQHLCFECRKKSLWAESIKAALRYTYFSPGRKSFLNVIKSLIPIRSDN